MPHPEQEHSLRVQLATALRERDAAFASETYWHSAAMKDRDTMNAVRSELAAANARIGKEHDALATAEEALAAARRECEVLRAELAKCEEALIVSNKLLGARSDSQEGK